MRSFFKKARDPISSFTHSLGAILSLIGLFFLMGKAAAEDVPAVKFLSITLFGLSLIALYSASGIYHYSNGSEEHIKRLRKLDHSMIYVLIAGSYTPILLAILSPDKAKIFISVIWIIAISGIILKVFFMNIPRWLTSGLYLLMGWAIAVDFGALVNMQKGAIWLLVAGGLAYTVGGIIYAIKKPNISEQFGFHEIFHLFIMLGSFFHFLMVYIYII